MLAQRSARRRAATTLTVAGDKSITHRALLCALIQDGPLEISGANLGGAVSALFGPMAMLGRPVSTTPNGVRVGDAAAGTRPVLDVGGSSAAARMLIGVLAGQGRKAIVDGSPQLRARPFSWVVDPLRELGASISYLGPEGGLPVSIGSGVYRPGRVRLSVGSAQARSAVLMAAVAARLPVEIEYPVLSRDHTERLLSWMGADIVRDGGTRLRYGGGSLRPVGSIAIPGDPSLAAYPVAAALVSEQVESLTIADVCLNSTRTGIFDVLIRAGVGIRYEAVREDYGESVGNVVVQGGLDGAVPVEVADAFTFHSLIDEVPLLASLATCIRGTSTIGPAHELTFKETDRIVTTAAMTAAFGGQLVTAAGSLSVTGGGPIAAATVDSFGDHRIAMSAATLGCRFHDRTTVVAGGCHRTSFPGFAEALNHAGGEVREA
ncbi:3-phosphoshikimate 1-carboxyvinyltransferase [Catellatospora tritici]|uniref:3-phosphoshikimate 1-carboxyvinyltransferase n=1 Tax=Catellatospora tritici TaxID=2851566 RepID=UPI001C2DD514|nr:3-phosphoshikimate 1-carboxyvinyltransferase [Catellatospora tritici]MBV1855773.1 3-phosphoshikimate 1-carboxyvinyltransferase [Catellatospora tritici]